MSSVKELLKKIINEEIEKLEEQNVAQLGAFINRALGSIQDGTCGSVCQKQIAKLDPSDLERLQRKGFLPDDRYQAIKSAREGNLKAARTWLGDTGMTGATSVAPTKAVAKAAQPASDAKGKGAAAGKAVAKKAATKRRPRRKSMDVLELQSLLKQRFGDRINLGKTGKNKDGVDGVYGGKTQRAINLLRKADKNAPKRQGSFKKSVRALVNYLKGAGKGSGAAAAKGISGKKYSAAEIGSVLKNMNLVVSPDDPKAKDLINKLMRAQAKGTQLSLRTIKMAGDTALGLKEIYQYAEDEDCEEWSVIIDEARELLERGEISKKVFKELKKSVPKGCGHH